MMNIDNNVLTEYLEEYSGNLPSILDQIERLTHLRSIHPQMLCGKTLGAFLSFMVQTAKAKNILEIGTFTAYSTICMASALPENGRITSLEKNAELHDFIQENIQKSGYESKIEVLFGDALDMIPQLSQEFDFIFIDANKEEYLPYYQAILPKVKRSGIIIADNVLWSGKVFDQSEQDKSTIAIREFNDFVQQDKRVSNVLLPVRDGIMLMQKA